ncbi:formin-like protein 7 [Triticum aestivum]|uniref:formin-like protein 7 n=1 Tax=Triticum aestivum TaxID=4565 RepID=UPI001D03409A|nr:formin-like protein 7 [Triticum aestivum]XP_044429670.1 formin-like protein 7 [Triticum aestivum]XP_044429671.1 formin-like protein 7 [Triticum aestivum]XP_044429672.1 formin-like protein 7 [Triticum aestivum]XP_044429673.1 formin-like protein 7 [Triticum aestivum]XP_044429674.1 formin-like protein 7 [Triticum aestivum]XP_044429675.1 formin-like protein 7 [Triticum aestivum]XP_044429676.1 formin-like protein 7 [Triticum aestivum]XP_044429677.1 formin-like protein 7 [Triticum aestivum]XP
MTVASLLPAPGSSVGPAPAVLTPEEVFGVLRDLTQAVQEIHMFLAGSYGPPPAAPPIAASAPPWLPWQPPHQAAFAALAGPLQLSSIATTAQPWLQWQPPLLAASAAPGATPQQPLQLQQPPPVSSTAQYGMPYDGTATTLFPSAPPPSQGVHIQQLKSPPPPSPLPSWIATRHVSAAVRLQAAVRGLLARRRVREMRGLQLTLLQVALRCAKDLDLVRCVGDLGHAVSPTGGGHAVFPVGSDLKVCDIGGWGGAPLLDILHRKPSTLPCAVQTNSHTHALLLSRWCPWDPGGCIRARPK